MKLLPLNASILLVVILSVMMISVTEARSRALHKAIQSIQNNRRVPTKGDDENDIPMSTIQSSGGWGLPSDNKSTSSAQQRSELEERSLLLSLDDGSDIDSISETTPISTTTSTPTFAGRFARNINRNNRRL